MMMDAHGWLYILGCLCFMVDALGPQVPNRS